ncbi:MAG: phospholipase D-like domain-containing protein [Woeseia sp.]
MTLQTLFLVLVHIGPASLGVYHALLYKRDPRAAMGWIMACIFIPYAGPIAYYLFGINRVRTRGRDLKRRFLHVDSEVGTRSAKASQRGELGIRDIGWRISGRSLTAGNAVKPLYNGDQAYPAMLEAIGNATRRVYLATYILLLDAVGEQFATALQAASERGVDVRVLIDGFGELYAFRRVTRTLRQRGIKVARFLPPRLFPPSINVNLRNHRKLLIIDDVLAFAGGMNIGMNHVSSKTGSREVSDVHFELRGPVISELAGVFRSDWHFATGNADAVSAESPAAPDGDMHCRVLPDGPDDELDVLSGTIKAAISSARETLDIMTPYFLPSQDLIGTLESAALRGVLVRLVLPARNNLPYMNWANRNVLADLLRWDIEAFYQPGPFCHAKLLCIDGNYSLIGSANLDARSLRLNFELGIEVFSDSFNAELKSYFNRVIAGSRRIELSELTQRSTATRIRDAAAALMSPYM